MVGFVSSARRRLPYIIALVIVPGVLGILGNKVIFCAFGNCHHLPIGSTGDHVLHWWDNGSRGALAGVVSLLVMIAAHRRLQLSLATALASAVLVYVYLAVFALVYLLLNPGALA